jgi:hypothetical protein
MGKRLAGSRFGHMAVSSAQGDALLYNLASRAYLSVRLAPGRMPAASGPLAALVRRASNLPESSLRSPQP